MHLLVISVGNKLSPWENDGINYYLKQIKNDINIDFINIKSQQNPKRSKGEVIKLETELILKKIPQNSFVISWDMKGESISSENLSQLFRSSMQKNIKICFVIGGSFGLGTEIIKSSNKVFSASDFTFPHRLFRIILVEQIYRALSIIKNTPYHK